MKGAGEDHNSDTKPKMKTKGVISLSGLSLDHRILSFVRGMPLLHQLQATGRGGGRRSQYSELRPTPCGLKGRRFLGFPASQRDLSAGLLLYCQLH